MASGVTEEGEVLEDGEVDDEMDGGETLVGGDSNAPPYRKLSSDSPQNIHQDAGYAGDGQIQGGMFEGGVPLARPMDDEDIEDDDDDGKKRRRKSSSKNPHHHHRKSSSSSKHSRHHRHRHHHRRRDDDEIEEEEVLTAQANSLSKRGSSLREGEGPRGAWAYPGGGAKPYTQEAESAGEWEEPATEAAANDVTQLYSAAAYTEAAAYDDPYASPPHAAATADRLSHYPPEYLHVPGPYDSPQPSEDEEAEPPVRRVGSREEGAEPPVRGAGSNEEMFESGRKRKHGVKHSDSGPVPEAHRDSKPRHHRASSSRHSLDYDSRSRRSDDIDMRSRLANEEPALTSPTSDDLDLGGRHLEDFERSEEYRPRRVDGKELGPRRRDRIDDQEQRTRHWTSDADTRRDFHLTRDSRLSGDSRSSVERRPSRHHGRRNEEGDGDFSPRRGNTARDLSSSRRGRGEYLERKSDLDLDEVDRYDDEDDVADGDDYYDNGYHDDKQSRFRNRDERPRYVRPGRRPWGRGQWRGGARGGYADQSDEETEWAGERRFGQKRRLVDTPMGDRPMCKFYMEGKCLKDQDCPFNHDGAPSAAAAVSPATTAGGSRKRDLCRFYLLGNCHKGKTCTYYHGDWPCKGFHKNNGNCSYGDTCKFSHSDLTEETRAILSWITGEDPNARNVGTVPGGRRSPPGMGGNIPSLLNMEIYPQGHVPKPPPRVSSTSPPNERNDGRFEDDDEEGFDEAERENEQRASTLDEDEENQCSPPRKRAAPERRRTENNESFHGDDENLRGWEEFEDYPADNQINNDDEPYHDDDADDDADEYANEERGRAPYTQQKFEREGPVGGGGDNCVQGRQQNVSFMRPPPGHYAQQQQQQQQQQQLQQLQLSVRPVDIDERWFSNPPPALGPGSGQGSRPAGSVGTGPGSGLSPGFGSGPIQGQGSEVETSTGRGGVTTTAAAASHININSKGDGLLPNPSYPPFSMHPNMSGGRPILPRVNLPPPLGAFMRGPPLPAGVLPPQMRLPFGMPPPGMMPPGVLPPDAPHGMPLGPMGGGPQLSGPGPQLSGPGPNSTQGFDIDKILSFLRNSGAAAAVAAVSQQSAAVSQQQVAAAVAAMTAAVSQQSLQHQQLPTTTDVMNGSVTTSSVSNQSAPPVRDPRTSLIITDPRTTKLHQATSLDNQSPLSNQSQAGIQSADQSELSQTGDEPMGEGCVVVSEAPDSPDHQEAVLDTAQQVDGRFGKFVGPYLLRLITLPLDRRPAIPDHVSTEELERRKDPRLACYKRIGLPNLITSPSLGVRPMSSIHTSRTIIPWTEEERVRQKHSPPPTHREPPRPHTLPDIILPDLSKVASPEATPTRYNPALRNSRLSSDGTRPTDESINRNTVAGIPVKKPEWISHVPKVPEALLEQNYSKLITTPPTRQSSTEGGAKESRHSQSSARKVIDYRNDPRYKKKKKPTDSSSSSDLPQGNNVTNSSEKTSLTPIVSVLKNSNNNSNNNSSSSDSCSAAVTAADGLTDDRPLTPTSETILVPSFLNTHPSRLVVGGVEYDDDDDDDDDDDEEEESGDNKNLSLRDMFKTIDPTTSPFC